MISRIITVVIFIAVIVTIFISLSSRESMVVIHKGNYDKKPIDIVLNHYQDSYCGMVIEDLEYSSQIIAPNGNTWFFHDHGDLILWSKDKDFYKDAVIWVYARDSREWINAREAWYSCDEVTPMQFGFGAYENRQDKFIDFESMRLRVLREETLANPYYKPQ